MTARPLGRELVPIRFGRIAGWSAIYAALVIAQALVIRVAGYEAFETDGPSMEPTLVQGDRFLVDKSAFGLTLPTTDASIARWADPVPGDLVVLSSPFDGIEIVKRVIGVAGDEIEIRDDVVYRNGASIRTRVIGDCPDPGDTLGCELSEERIGDRTWRISQEPRGVRIPEAMPRVVVPDGHVFVLGDHRDRSNDSRNPRLGTIPVERVRGRGLAIYWSDDVARIGTWLE